MMLAGAAGGSGGGGNGMSGVLAAATAFGTNLMNNRANRRAQAAADRHNWNLWWAQNTYNHPVAQMQRFQQAGLNPNLIYGKGSSGMAGAPTPKQAAKVKFDNPLQNITAFQDVRLRAAQSDNLRVQNDVLAQEAVLKSLQSSEVAARTARTKFDLGLAKDLRQNSVDAAVQNLRLLEQNTIGRELENTFKDKAMADMVKEVFYRVQNAKLTLTGKNLENELKREELELAKLGIYRNDPWWSRIFTQSVTTSDNSGKIKFDPYTRNPWNPNSKWNKGINNWIKKNFKK